MTLDTSPPPTTDKGDTIVTESCHDALCVTTRNSYQVTLSPTTLLIQDVIFCIVCGVRIKLH